MVSSLKYCRVSLRVSYFFGTEGRDPSLENYPITIVPEELYLYTLYYRP